MSEETNPYTVTTATESDAGSLVDSEEIRRPWYGTVLICFWTLEGGVKAWMLGRMLLDGFNPLSDIRHDYQTTNQVLFFVIAWYLLVETIGPWIGIYYLTGRRSRTIPFERALLRTLLLSATVVAVMIAAMMVYFEFT